MPVGSSSARTGPSYGRFPRLSDRRRQVAGTMSGGEQQMLALARGLATDPAVPTAPAIRSSSATRSWWRCWA